MNQEITKKPSFQKFPPFFCKRKCNNCCVVDIRGSALCPAEIPGMSAGLLRNESRNRTTLDSPMIGHEVWRNGNSHDVPLGVQETRQLCYFHVICWQDTGGDYGFDTPAGRRWDLISQSRENWKILSYSEHRFPVHHRLGLNKQQGALKGATAWPPPLQENFWALYGSNLPYRRVWCMDIQ